MTPAEFPTVVKCDDKVQYLFTRRALIEKGYQEGANVVEVSRETNYVIIDKIGPIVIFNTCDKQTYEKYESDETE